MLHFFKTPTYFATEFRCASHHISTTSNHCRKLSTTPIQQRNRTLVPTAVHCSSHSELNQKWTERFQKLDAVWSKRYQELDAVWSKRYQELDAVWSKRYQELDAVWSKRFQEADPLRLKSAVELQAMRLERSQKQWKENEHLSLRIQGLSDRTATGRESINLKRLKQILNIRGAMRYMVQQAKLVEHISPTAGTQEGLNEMAKWEVFTTNLEKEVEARGLTVQGVMEAFHRLDSLVSKPLLFDLRSTVTVPYAGFTDEERAALVILFKVQEKWQKPFLFDEEKSGEKDENLDSEYESDLDSEDESEFWEASDYESDYWDSESESDLDSEDESDSDSEHESDSDSGSKKNDSG
ncbi:hypothetical protein B9Z19DRAFT_1061608 [Tuber borchii]|uniref:Uncharacterized protein n=1 Tax=Tuber borchii TaxID=42251 RepID=A0A2T7A4U8_TUBBO|nr:hypothetical protein B9Z19DRAFT_1061608 [Tuber borchii]